TQQILSTKHGSPVLLDDGMLIDGRSHVMRFHVTGDSSTAPSSVIVKQANLRGNILYDPDALEGPAVQFFDDWAGIEFLNRVADGSRLCPYLYGHDRAKGILVLEDLPGVELLAILQGNDPLLAKTALVAMAARIGQMHALTIGQQISYQQI